MQPNGHQGYHVIDVILRKVNQDPGVVKLHVNTSHFSTTARQVTHLHVKKPLIKSNPSIEILHGYQTLFESRETEKKNFEYD